MMCSLLMQYRKQRINMLQYNKIRKIVVLLTAYRLDGLRTWAVWIDGSASVYTWTHSVHSIHPLVLFVVENYSFCTKCTKGTAIFTQAFCLVGRLRTRYYQEAREAVYSGPTFLLAYLLSSLPITAFSTCAASLILFRSQG